VNASHRVPIVLSCVAGGTQHLGDMHRRVPGLCKKMLIRVLDTVRRNRGSSGNDLTGGPPELTVTSIQRNREPRR